MSAPKRPVPLHERVERILGSGDMRLIYGLAVPLLIAIGFIVALAFSGKTWLVAPLVLVIVALIGIIVVGFNQMLDDDAPEDDEEEAG
jgi:hypothetical protein